MRDKFNAFVMIMMMIAVVCCDTIDKRDEFSLRGHNLKVVEGLEPPSVWKYFSYVSAIPRPPTHEEAVAKWVQQELGVFSGVTFVSDAVGNMVFKVPATPTFEYTPGIAIQSHLDMVCEVDDGVKHECDKDGIVLMRNKQFVHAQNTSLGADNGIGLAIAMALAQEAATFNHGELEFLFTVQEEIGLQGALKMPQNMLSSKILVNLDNFREGTILIGCAGGRDTQASIEIEYADSTESVGTYVYDLELAGLTGGHSGGDAHLGRGNSIKVFAQLLKQLTKKLPNAFHISDIRGGTKRNAIARFSRATIHVQSDGLDQVQTIADEFVELTKQEYQHKENITVTITSLAGLPTEKPMSTAFLTTLLNTLDALPSGVIQLEPEMTNVVRTSANLGVILSDHKTKTVNVTMMSRSLFDSAKNETARQIRSVFEMAKFTDINDEAGYPSWTPNPESYILKEAITLFGKLFEQKPNITAMHVGVEPAVIKSKHDHPMEMLSLGPTILDAHSPSERLEISSVERVYRYTKELIKFIADMEKI